MRKASDIKYVVPPDFDCTIFPTVGVRDNNATFKLPELAAERFANLRAEIPVENIPLYGTSEPLKGVDLDLLVQVRQSCLFGMC